MVISGQLIVCAAAKGHNNQASNTILIFLSIILSNASQLNDYLAGIIYTNFKSVLIIIFITYSPSSIHPMIKGPVALASLSRIFSPI